MKIVSVSVSSLPGLLCDVSTGVHCPLVPAPLRRAVFDSFYQVTHPGKRASQRLVSCSFVWQFLAKDVNLWTQSCFNCQPSKVQSHVKSPVYHILVPGQRFMWTWLVFFLSPMGSPTSSPSLIVQPDGWRQFLFTKQQQKIVLKFFFAHGFLCL